MSESADALPAEPDPAAIGFAVLASGMEEAIAAVQAEIATLSRVLQASAGAPHAVPPPAPPMAAKPEQPPEPWARAPDDTPPAGQGTAEPRDAMAMAPPPAQVPAPAEPRSLPMTAPGVPETAGAPKDRTEVYAPPPPATQTTTAPPDADLSARPPPATTPPVLAPAQLPTGRVADQLGFAPSASVASGSAELAGAPASAVRSELVWAASEPVSPQPTAALPMGEPSTEVIGPAWPPTPRPVDFRAAALWPANVTAPTWASLALTQIAPMAPACAPPAPTQMAPAAPDMLPLESSAPNSSPATTDTRTTTHQHHHTSDRSTALHGDVFLDGMRVGHWLAETLAREAGGPAGGGTSFDPRLGPRWPGALQGQ